MKISKNDPPSVGRLISILHRKTQIYLQRELEPYGLGHGEVRLLYYLHQNRGVRQQQLTTHFQLDKGSTSSMISSLEKKGFIRRDSDPDDKRASLIFLTERTTEILPELTRIFKGWGTALQAGLGKEEQAQLIGLLTTVIANADQALEKRASDGQG